MKSFVAIAIFLASAVAAQHAPPLGMRAHRRGFSPEVLKRMNEILDKRDPLPQGGIPGVNISFPGTGDPTDSASESASQSTSSQTPDPSTSTTSSTRQNNPPPDQSTSTTSTSTSTSSSTSTTSTSSSSSASTSASASTSNAAQASVITRSVLDTYQGITLASTRTSTVRSSSTSTDSAEPTDDSSGSSFSQNKVAVAATATVAALVALGALIFIAFWWKKKSKRGQMAEDMWDEASMKEFSHPAGTPIVAPPPPVMRNVDLDSEMGDPVGAGLGRSNTKVLPSQAALARSRSTHQHEQQHVYEEDPDTLLAMPPVAHYERPRDSAYDIVPAAPPAAAYAQTSNNAAYGYGNAYASGSGSAGSSGSGGLQPPVRKGDHTSFGSGLGNDPFAGTGFVDASRESTYGPGQAGRGAGYAAQGQDQQWNPAYNPYTGYSQQQGGAAQGYGGGYGYAN